MWYRFAVARIPLINPVMGGFWVDDDLIEYGKPFFIEQWAKLLSTDTRKLNSQQKLNEFLSNAKFEYVDGQRTYVPTKRGGITLELNNPLDEFYVIEKIENPDGGFWLRDIKIEKNQKIGVREWARLLGTRTISINKEEKLLDFLRNSNFEVRDGKKTYIRNTRNLLTNNLFDFYVIDNITKKEKPIPFGISYVPSGWASLLKTKQKNTNSQEDLDNFLSNGLFEDVEGKKIYKGQKKITKEISDVEKPIVDYKTKGKKLINYYDDFYIKNELSDYELIELGTEGNGLFWSRKLRKTTKDVNSQEKLNNILQDSNFNIYDEKKYYIPRGQKELLRNNFDLFYVGDMPVSHGQKYGKYEWARLLSTNFRQIESQSKLDIFLGDEKKFEEKDGKKTYIKKASGRERLFERRFENYNHNEITVKPQQDIIITDSKNYRIKNLRLDFAFKKNEKILLAVEINGIQHYGFTPFGKSKTYNQWQNGLNNDILKINYCHNNNIPLLIFHHMLSEKQFESILNNLHQNPNAYDNYIPQPVIDNDVNNTSLEFVKRQIYSHLYPVFNGTITFTDDESKKRYIKDTLILISKLLGIYEGGIDKTDYIRAFNRDIDLTSNYNICLSIYNSLYPNFPLDKDEKITYSDLSKKPRFYKEKSPVIEPAENIIPSEE